MAGRGRRARCPRTVELPGKAGKGRGATIAGVCALTQRAGRTRRSGSVSTSAAGGGVDLVWLESVLAFAPPPDLVCFLDVAPADSLQRHREIAEARLDADGLDAYREFQEGVYRVFDEAARRWGFTRVPATADIGSTHAALDRVVGDLLDGGGADAAHRRLPASLRGRR